MLHEVRTLPSVAGVCGADSVAVRAGAALLAGPLAALPPAAPEAGADAAGLAAVVLHAAAAGDVSPLLSWLRRASSAPGGEVVLDTAAGVPLAGAGHLSPDAVDALVDAVRRDAPALSDGESVTTVGVSLYDALGRDDVRLLSARLVHLLAPGVPCLSAEALASLDGAPAVSGLDADPVAALLRRPVLDASLRLVRLRREHPAFEGDFDCGPGTVPATASPDVDQAPCVQTAAELRERLGGAAAARRRAADPLAERSAESEDPPVHAAWLRWTRGDDQVVLVVDPEQDAFTLAVTTPTGWACARSVREVRDLAVPVAA